MVKARNMVIAGKYQRKSITLLGRNPIIILKFGFKSNCRKKINNDTVESYDIQNTEQNRSASKNIGKGLLFGMAGINSVSPKDNIYAIRINWRDGESSLIEIDNDIYKVLQVSCFK